jgi:hypothetical protein
MIVYQVKGGIMKKILIPLLLAAFAAQAAPVLVEAYQQESIFIPDESPDTVDAIELNFAVDTACIVQFSTGAKITVGRGWLELDGDSLSPIIETGFGVQTLSTAYSYLMPAGEHTVIFKFNGGYASSSVCAYGYLQALIFLPDTSSAVAEPPLETRGLSPLSASIVSRGPYVNVAGATELVDATGRVIENAIENDKVYLSNLSTGTYFAQDGERTVVKIVKIQ